MKKPVIGITGNQRPFREEEGMYLSYTPTGFVQGVQEAGGIPLILPIGDPASQVVSMFLLSFMEQKRKLSVTITCLSVTFLNWP